LGACATTIAVARINVLVATTSPDVTAEVIAEAVASRPDMSLLERRPVAPAEVDALLGFIPAAPQCALIAVGRPGETKELADRWLLQRSDIVVMEVDVAGDTVRISVRAPRLDPLLTALRELVERVVAQVPEQAPPEPAAPVAPAEKIEEPPPGRPLLDAAIDWLHKLLRDAIDNVPDENGDVHGLSVTRATLLQALDTPEERRPSPSLSDFTEADEALDRALAAADPNTEPLAAAARVLELSPLEFRMMLLALAPELDLRFQRCIGFLLDELGRRTGTIALYATLLGSVADVRARLSGDGSLAQWLVFEGTTGRPPAADEPLRLDPFLAQWLLGDAHALASDPRVRRLLRLVPWTGAVLLQRPEERQRAAELIEKLDPLRWLLLADDDPAGWRALFELSDYALLRVETSRMANADVIDVEDCARRIGRLARLTGAAIVIDAVRGEGSEAEDDGLRLFLATLNATHAASAVIAGDAARMVKLFGSTPHELESEPALPRAAVVEAIRAAASAADAYVTEELAESIASRHPLSIDRLEQAMRLAASRPLDGNTEDPALARFTAAAREVAGEGVSHLAERIEPVFTLDDVVLPADRKQQLHEIVDHVRLAPRVLGDWKFGARLPYGRGVTALFHGPSGTGKTMAAMGVARQLGIQLLRLDFSKVVSKYIGDTEKNIDRVFTDAQKSGSAILIDEADALLGKRSEVKDAHDRYANIEVAYLLQRMETYPGLAILTTNLRQNLDPAFVRRLRFIVDFPKPAAEARQQIWRLCLPEGSHELDDAAIRQLARKIDLAGGPICQITLRAAFIAAAAGTLINLGHIVHAARAEYAKLGMQPVEIDAGAGRKAA
jgi:SpoVK/Ycf46/Vps4 family AAA+-type ATPase